MNIKMTNSQLSTANPRKQKQTKQTTRTGTESQKWRSHGGLSACLLYTSDAADESSSV